MKSWVSLCVRLGLAGGCLAYAAWDVDFHRLLTVVAAFRWWAVVLYVASILVFLLPGAFRLRFLVGGAVTVRQGLGASLIGLGLNNVLPARLGEMAKALSLRHKGSLSLGRALEAVFWERFFDCNALLALGLVVAVLLGKGVVFYPLLAAVGGGWGFLLLLGLRPAMVQVVSRFVPGQRARLFVSELLLLLRTSLGFGFFGRLSLWTLIAWAGYCTSYAIGLCLMAELPADPVMILTVFAVATLGLAVPAAPGGMGVFEAAAVLALGWFGVDKDRALAVGLALHLLQYLPLTLLGLGTMAGSGLSVRDLRRRSEADSENG